MSEQSIRHRIKEHRRVRAGDLLVHELNYRAHPDHQKEALRGLYREIGFARSLLAYELPDGRLKLIDGHLRRDLDPDMEVEVEVLDVNEDEARTLLLTIDPLAALAEVREQIKDRLEEVAPKPCPEVETAWEAAREKALSRFAERPGIKSLPEQFYVLIPCRDEDHQVELLQRFLAEGIECKAVLS